MSAPERLFIKRLRTWSEGVVTGYTEEELRVCLASDLGDEPGKSVVTAVPRAEDLAFVVSKATDEWLVEFVRALLKRSLDRAMAVSAALQEVQDPELTEIGGFGMCPGDSKALLELRLAIDTHLGWPDPTAEQAADYVGRIKQVGESLCNTGTDIGALERTLQIISAEDLPSLDNVDTYSYAGAVELILAVIAHLRSLDVNTVAGGG